MSFFLHSAILSRRLKSSSRFYSIVFRKSTLIWELLKHLRTFSAFIKLRRQVRPFFSAAQWHPQRYEFFSCNVAPTSWNFHPIGFSDWWHLISFRRYRSHTYRRRFGRKLSFIIGLQEAVSSVCCLSLERCYLSDWKSLIFHTGLIQFIFWEFQVIRWEAQFFVAFPPRFRLPGVFSEYIRTPSAVPHKTSSN